MTDDPDYSWLAWSLAIAALLALAGFVFGWWSLDGSSGLLERVLR